MITDQDKQDLRDSIKQVGKSVHNIEQKLPKDHLGMGLLKDRLHDFEDKAVDVCELR